jgi:hypothetical protein
MEKYTTVTASMYEKLETELELLKKWKQDNSIQIEVSISTDDAIGLIQRDRLLRIDGDGQTNHGNRYTTTLIRHTPYVKSTIGKDISEALLSTVDALRVPIEKASAETTINNERLLYIRDDINNQIRDFEKKFEARERHLRSEETRLSTIKNNRMIYYMIGAAVGGIIVGILSLLL